MSLEQHYDALLVLSFGGPEGPEEVVPFLENVTRGRGIPRERLKVVGEHYFHFDGISPLNRLNKEIIANVEQELLRRDLHLPIYFGNRNWHPFGEETAEKMAADGVRNALVFSTSAWGGYSGCRQYDEDIQRIRQHLADKGLPEITFTKLRQFYDHPKFITAMAQAVTESYAQFSAEDSPRMIFTAHSVPLSANDAAGGPEDAQLYERQVAEASRLVAQEAGIKEYDLVWQSRSGSPAIPWLEPDIVDHASALHDEQGIKNLVVCPIGFISDHMEVVWDLDTELRQATDERGMHMERTRTAGPTALFTQMVVDLVEEHTSGRTPEGLGAVTVNGCTVNGAACHEGCCQPAKRPMSRTA
ncbi:MULTISPECIES: ferrochelatase [unclassified Corynebacterium]|uniref:ferrochelatase n=1 Tax=unclassified Corynebacterium TaxID=2624378 RepID=UPI0029CA7AD7|nr:MULTISPECIES: ferrochelatase [unclassified Corynebacterium]WPF67212.1 ferrochelatase [Corynebacterium sp. 22KM0430]WPF69701.1 ferrochelatase [Corynebacterium sp. 21KM1197]